MSPQSSPASSPEPSRPADVLVAGAGISGLACARALRESGVTVRVVDRGRRVGGRMSGRTLHGRPVDLGASYFTVPEFAGAEPTGPESIGPDSARSDVTKADFAVPRGSGFAEVVASWVDRGLARPWTDTFAAIDASRTSLGDAEGETESDASGASGAAGRFPIATGPMRYAAGGGLRSLVADLAEGLDVLTEHDVTRVNDDGTVGGVLEGATSSTTHGAIGGIRHRVVVLAMPEPQAARLLEPASPVHAHLDTSVWQPTIAVALGFGERVWPADLHGAFVENSPVLTFVADDGDRRGDGAPVLVAHTTAAFARAHLADPESAVAEVQAEVARVLGLGSVEPSWTHAHRWRFARAASTHPEPFVLLGGVAVCGDAWGGRSSVATAWASGDALGRAIAARG
ncbi:NAD(P)/FAD-dependent oxidoreductase [Herbiconiux daphne]|uniref:FAD-dependent oxidoreductase n=1 Tax=Herbiconiux daphne TaxID=2970914 RepID=A0ABT2H0N9_9MICO|nr:FAD-dependent oxidoreductase [Herbiconiux daphne]MCS5733493.1 FAD-dependent oxidoreductase [Herbiconiux daphne]